MGLWWFCRNFQETKEYYVEPQSWRWAPKGGLAMIKL